MAGNHENELPTVNGIKILSLGKNGEKITKIFSKNDHYQNMAEFLINKFFRILMTALNYVPPSILADILLHPFDFATVLLQIGFDPEGIKNESATLVSVILQYALFTFYIPYLLTSIHGLQFMGMPHPSIFYYVNYIYNQEGFMGCYRGLILKIWERLIMVGVNERVRKRIHKDSLRLPQEENGNESDEDKFTESLINDICSQFFAVLLSHPFHVLMVSSFAEFTNHKKSSFSQLLRSIYEVKGYFGFFAGLTARLLGEILSLIFSATYTAIINKQSRPQQEAVKFSQVSSQKNVNHLVNYVTNMSRFTALKPSECEDTSLSEEFSELGTELQENEPTGSSKHTFINLLESITLPHNGLNKNSRPASETQTTRPFAFLDFVPFTSKLFYYIVIRDYLSKKISNPFFLVCHCAIILGSGWDKFPVAIYLHSLVDILSPNSTLGKSMTSSERKKPMSKITCSIGF